MDWLQAIVYGIVQGLTEFLPISSSGHILLTGDVIFKSDPGAAFTAVIQMGTALAVLIYFIKDIWRILKAWFLSLFGKVPHSDPDARMGWFVIVGTIPVAVLGLLFKDLVTSAARNLWVTVAMLFIVGVVLLVADVYTANLTKRAGVVNEDATEDAPEEDPDRARRGFSMAEEDVDTAVRPAMVFDDAEYEPELEPAPEPGRLRTLTGMTWPHAIIVGLAQALALIPGVSRSGATTSAGLFLGYDRLSAARYSFLLSIPAIWASGLFELKDINTASLSWGPTILATLISFVVGFAVIAWLLRFISTHTFRGFAIYRIVLAVVVAGLLITGVTAAVV